MIRKEKYPIDFVLSKRTDVNTKTKDCQVDFDGDLIKMNSLRYELFDLKGCVCAKCKIKGSFFAKEKNKNAQRFHFNLYAIDENGKDVLMTKDHIIPKFHGGKDTVFNFQTMCARCNVDKGSKLSLHDFFTLLLSNLNARLLAYKLRNVFYTYAKKLGRY